MMNRATIWLAGVTLLLATGLRAERPRTLLIAAGYHEMQALVLNADSRQAFDHNTRIRVQPPEVLEQYGTIMLCDGSDLDADTDALRAYLESGGNVVIVGQAARLYVPKYQALFGRDATYGPVPGYGIVYAEHPLLADPDGGVAGIDAKLDDTLDALVGEGGGPATGLEPMAEPDDDEDAPRMALPDAPQAQDWPAAPIQDSLVNAAGGFAVIANENHASLWVKEFGTGKGRLVFIADTMCPTFLRESHWKWATRSNDAFLARLWTYLGVPKLEAVATVATPTWWYRPVQSLEGARRLWPHQPQAGEDVTTLTFVAGQDEYERRMVYLSLPRTPQAVRVHGVEGAALPVRVGLQDAPTPDYFGSLCYVRWLQDGEALAPTAPVLTVWVQVDTRDAAPGTHRSTLRLDVDGTTLALELEVEVLPVRLPREHRFLVDYEFYILNMLYPYGYQDTWPAHWQEMGMDVLLSGYLPYPDLESRLPLTDGRDLLQAAQAAPEPLRLNWPPLDFTRAANGRFDLMVQTCVANNLLSFRTYDAFGLREQHVVALAQALYRDETLTEESPEVAAVLGEFARQAGAFLRSKGMLNLYSKRFDEWHAEGVDPYLRLARPMAAAGWANMANPNVKNVLLVPELRDRLYPVMHAVWLQSNDPAEWAQLTRDAPLTPPPGGMVGGYMSFNTSSYWWDASVLQGMRTLWASAWRRDAGYHRHGWGTRGTYAAAGVYPLPGWRQLCPSIGLLMASEAVDDARYGILLQEMIDAIAASDPAVAEALRARWRAIVGDAPGARLPVSGVGVDAEATPTLATFYAARRELLLLLQDAQAALPRTPPSLRWHSLPLVASGASAYRIQADPGLELAAAELQRAIHARSGVTLPIAAGASGSGPALRLCTPQTAATAFAPLLSDRYPADGAYLFLDDADGDLWIVAREPETHMQAIQNLLLSSRLEPRWYRPTPAENPTP